MPRRILPFLVIVCGVLAWGCAASPSPSASTGQRTAPPGGAVQTQSPARQREAAIPSGAVKVSPKLDAAPPILHSDEWQSPGPRTRRREHGRRRGLALHHPRRRQPLLLLHPRPHRAPRETAAGRRHGHLPVAIRRRNLGRGGESAPAVARQARPRRVSFRAGDTLWFCSAREGFTGIGWFTARLLSGRWTGWEYASGRFKPEYEVGELHITSDGRELYFHSPRPGGQGQLDIWVTRLVNGVWQAPENVQAVNSPESDGWPFVSQDGSELWFTRTYKGSPAIYRSIKSRRHRGPSPSSSSPSLPASRRWTTGETSTLSTTTSGTGRWWKPICTWRTDR